MSPASTQDRFDPLSADFAADPYAVYATLREAAEPLYHSGLDVHLLSRYADVDAAARNPLMVRTREAFLEPETLAAEHAAAAAAMPNHFRYVQFSLLDSDGTVHRRLRKLLLGQFAKRAVERFTPIITSHLNHLLEGCLEQGEFDFIADLAAHVPGWIIGHVLGVPPADRPQLKLWSENIVQFFDAGRTAEHAALAEANTAEFADYLKALVANHRQTQSDDLLSLLIAAKEARQLNETELISTCMLVLMAGHGSTIDALGTGLHALLLHPQEFDRLRREPALMSTAVHEMFRFESPLPYFHRYAAEPVEIGGKTYAEGTKFGLLYGAASRDPEAFVDPERLRVDRRPNRHLAFGRGAHLCLGNNLSRLDMEIFLTLLLARTEDIQCLETEPIYKRGITERGLERLRIAVRPR